MESVVLEAPQLSLLKKVGSDIAGLTQAEAKKRLERYGLNVLTVSQKKTILVAFFMKFANPLILILLFASGISFLPALWWTLSLSFPSSLSVSA